MTSQKNGVGLFTFGITIGEQPSNPEQTSHPGHPIIRPAVFGRGRAKQQFEFGLGGDKQCPLRQLETQQPSNKTKEGNDWTNTESSITDSREKHKLDDQCKSLMNELEGMTSRDKDAKNTIAHLKRESGVLQTTVTNLHKEICLLKQANKNMCEENVKLKKEATSFEETKKKVVKLTTKNLTAVHDRIVGEIKAQHERELQRAKEAVDDDSRKAKEDAAEAKLKEEVKRLEEAHEVAIQMLTAEHDRVMGDMKSQHERELQAKSVEVLVGTASPVDYDEFRTSSPVSRQARDASIRHGSERRYKTVMRRRDVASVSGDSGVAESEETIRDWQLEEREGRERDMEEIMGLLANLDKKLDGKVGKLETLIESKHLDGRHGHRNDVKAMKGNMDKKIDLKVDHLENCIDSLVQEMRAQHQSVTQAVQNMDVKGSFSKVEGLVGGLQKKIEDSRQEGRKNHQALTNAIGSNGQAIGDVGKMTDALLQDDHEQHAEVRQGFVNLGEEGEKMEKLLHVLLGEGRQQSKDLKQTIQDLNGDIDTKVSNLTQTLQRDGGPYQQDMLNAISSLNEEIEKMLSELSESLDQNGGEQHNDLKQTIEELDQGFQAKMANLEDLIDSNHCDEGQQRYGLGENFDGKLSELLVTLQQGGQVQHTEVTRVIKNLDSEIDKKVKNSLEEWAEDFCFKTVNTSTIKVCSV